MGERLATLKAKAGELAKLGAEELGELLIEIAEDYIGKKDKTEPELRELVKVWRDRKGRGIDGVDDSAAVSNGDLKAGDDELAAALARTGASHKAGTDAAHRILAALVVVLTDERLGGDPGKCCGAVTVLVGGAIDGRVAVRQMSPAFASACHNPYQADI